MNDKEIRDKMDMVVRGYSEGDVTFEEALGLLGGLYLHCSLELESVVYDAIKKVIHEKVSEIFA